MVKNLLLFSLLLLGSQQRSFSQKTSLLWEVSGNELNTKSYLFGTIHLIPTKDYFFSKQYKNLFNTCENLVLEIDLNAMTIQQKIEVAKQALLPQGVTLSSLMSKEAYQKLKIELMTEYGIKEKRIDTKYQRIKPFFLSGIILKDYIGKIKTYETELIKYAKKNNMEMMGLETIEDQMSIVEKVSLKEQIEKHLQIEDLKEYDTLLGLYIKEDLNGMYEMAQKSMETESDFEEEFINKRNKKWIPVIEKIINKKATFVAVGALHLPGPNGVISLLKSKGYTVLPIGN